MVEHACIATSYELIYYYTKWSKGTVIYKKYIDKRCIILSRLLPISSGSMDIKGVQIKYLNVGGALATEILEITESALFIFVPAIRHGLSLLKPHFKYSLFFFCKEG